MFWLFYSPQTWDILWPNFKQPNSDYETPPPSSTSTTTTLLLFPVTFRSWLGMCFAWKASREKGSVFSFFLFICLASPLETLVYIWATRRWFDVWALVTPQAPTHNCVSMELVATYDIKMRPERRSIAGFSVISLRLEPDWGSEEASVSVWLLAFY